MDDSNRDEKDTGGRKEFKQNGDDAQWVGYQEYPSKDSTDLSMTLDELVDPGAPFGVGFEGKPTEELIELGMRVSGFTPIPRTVS